MKIEIFKEKCNEYINDFINKVKHIEYDNTGIVLNEAFSFCVMCNIFEIDLIIESGTGKGISTEIFAQYFENKKIITHDNCSVYGNIIFEKTKNKLSKYKNITLIKNEINKRIFDDHRHLNIALFFDGPKGKKAINLAKKCFENKNVKFVGIHDECHKERYHEMDIWNKTFFYSDEDWFIKKYNFLDKKASFSLQGRGIGYALNEN